MQNTADEPGPTKAPTAFGPIHALVLSFTALVAVLLLPSMGTTDMGEWARYVQAVLDHGLRNGYAISGAEYPPLSFFGFGFSALLAKTLAVPIPLAVKIALLVATLASVTVFHLWKRNATASTILGLVLIPGAMGLAYVDVFILPLLFAALWRMERGDLFSTAFFGWMAIFTKWQPLILLPFAVVYLWKSRNVAGGIKPLGWALLGSLAAALPVLAFFSPGDVVDALTHSLSRKNYSMQGLNAPWIYQTLASWRQGVPIDAPFPFVEATGVFKLLFRGAFLAAYGLLLLRFFLTPPTFRGFLVHACLGFSAYFFLNIGVHENHLFLAAMLAMCLLPMSRRADHPFIAFFALCHLVNLFFFYGLTGALPLQPLPFGMLSLGVAVVNVAFWIYILRDALKRHPRGSARTPQPETT